MNEDEVQALSDEQYSAGYTDALQAVVDILDRALEEISQLDAEQS